MIRQRTIDKSLQFICCTARSLPAIVAMKWRQKCVCVSKRIRMKKEIRDRTSSSHVYARHTLSNWKRLVVCACARRPTHTQSIWHLSKCQWQSLLLNSLRRRQLSSRLGKKLNHAIPFVWRRTCAICNPLSLLIALCLADWDRIYRRISNTNFLINSFGWKIFTRSTRASSSWTQPVDSNSTACGWC